MHNDIWWLTFLVMAGIFIIILGLGIIALIFQEVVHGIRYTVFWYFNLYCVLYLHRIQTINV